MKRKHERSVWMKIFVPLVAAMLAQVTLILGGIYAKGTIRELNHNEISILDQKVINRADYLEESMRKWSDMGAAVRELGGIAERYGALFEKGPEADEVMYTSFLNEAAPKLIELLRRNSVNGVFLVLSTQEPEAAFVSNKPGLYIRDLDSRSEAPLDNSDLLAKRLPGETSRQLHIANDSDWQPVFRFGEGEMCYDFFRMPYTEAFRRENWESGELGYWSGSYCLTEDNQKVISYSVPLRLAGGTVYGVLGIDVTEEYLKEILNYHELNGEDCGAYVLGIRRDERTLMGQVIHGPVLEETLGQSVTVRLEQDARSRGLEEAYYVRTDGKGDYYAGVRPLKIYDTNSPFERDVWSLCGAVRSAELFAFSGQIDRMIKGIAALCLLMGTLIVVLVTLIISRPLMRMVRSVRDSDPREPVKLPLTGVKELDELGDAIGQLSENVFDFSTKFNQIIRLASVELAGVEIDETTGKLFLSDGFFSMFGRPEVDAGHMDADEFHRLLAEFDGCITRKRDNETLYKIVRDGETTWVRLRIVVRENKWCGLAENVTKELLEIQKVEYERDYDTLTNLLNRSAFKAKAREILEKNEPGVCAVLMVDLDNLKLLNDTYGHDWGDRYIRLTARSLRKHLPVSALVARRSGDEFLALLYGYSDRDEIREILRALEDSIREEYLILPDNKPYRLRMSGGVAWYPGDAAEYQDLVKFADFAMYKVKNSVKGRIWEFDKESYLKEYYLLQNKEELNKLIEQCLVEYYFQPIVSVESGEIYAFEALMRSSLSTIPTVREVLTLAKQEYKLDQIERLTWFQAMDAFMELRRKGAAGQDCRVFINSIPNQILSEEDCRIFEESFRDGLSSIVLEVTEEEKMNEEIQERKHRIIRRWGGQVAIDDYGTGYNGQSILIKTSPEYVKIDMGFVRDVHRDEKKQALIASTVDYAHRHNIRVIAEGVENVDEVRRLVELGIDFMQGYYYARPAAWPGPLDEARKQELRILHRELSS